MNTHNVNVKTATPESPKTWVKTRFEILLAEGEKGMAPEDHEVYSFASLDELVRFRKKWPEKMKGSYGYELRAGAADGATTTPVLNAAHFRAFVRAVRAAGIGC